VLVGSDTPLRVRARSAELPSPGDHVRVRVDAAVACIAV
jgi:hypothetical protein